jgi:hypothetical protein
LNSEARQEYLQLFGDVFAGRFDCYAYARPHRNPEKAAKGKLEYILVREPLTQAVLQDHLDGRQRIGIYPLVDNYIRWFAIDFDAPKDPETGDRIADYFPQAWEQALEQVAAFETAGLFVYLERSRSGNGVHLWGFFDEPIDAALTLQALKPLLVDAASYDRMYPVQKEVKAGGFGNLIALPFHGESLREGHSAFLHPDTLEPIEPLTFLRSVQFNNRYVIEELAERAPKTASGAGRVASRADGAEGSDEREFTPDFSGRPEHPQRGFLKMVSHFGCKFMHHCVKDAATVSQTEWWVAVGQTTCFRHGRDAAHLISQLDRKRYDAGETDALYDRLMQHPPHGCAYIHANFPEHACTGCPMTAPYHVARKPILELARETKAPLERQNWKQAVDRIAHRRKTGEKPGVPWNTAGLDALSRARPAEFTIIGARPSIGKTALMVDLIFNMATHGVPVLVFSAEMGAEPLTERILARATGIDSLALRNEALFALSEEQLAHLYDWADRLASLPIYINYGATRPDQILDLVEETVLTERLPLDQPYAVFMDYIQFGNATDSTAGPTEYARLTKVSQEFKYIAQILHQSFTAFAQLKREAEGDSGVAVNELKGTGQFEQDANNIFALTGERLPGARAPRQLHILKQTNGQVGAVIDLLLHQQYCYFEPLSAYEPPVPKGDLFADTEDGLDRV